MRVISIDGCYDVPYDEFMIGITKSDSDIEIYARDKNGLMFILASCGTLSAAKEELERIRNSFKANKKIHRIGED